MGKWKFSNWTKEIQKECDILKTFANILSMLIIHILETCVYFGFKFGFLTASKNAALSESFCLYT